MSDIQPVPLLDLKAQYAPIREEIRAAMDRVADAQYFIGGPEVEGLEREVAAYSQCQFGIGVSSGTDALIVALMAVEIKPGDEVITTPYTFFATGGCIHRLGAVPVFVDIDPDSYNIDPAQIEAAITPRTRVIMPVHLYGQMADMDPIMAHRGAPQADRHRGRGSGHRRGVQRQACRLDRPLRLLQLLPVQEPGRLRRWRHGDDQRSGLAERVKWLRNHGMNPKYYHKYVGGNFRLDALQAAVLRVKLKYLDGWTAGRQRNADRYRRLFAEAGLAGEIGLPHDLGFGRHIYNQFVIRTGRRDCGDRQPERTQDRARDLLSRAAASAGMLRRLGLPRRRLPAQ